MPTEHALRYGAFINFKNVFPIILFGSFQPISLIDNAIKEFLAFVSLFQLLSIPAQIDLNLVLAPVILRAV